MESILQSIKQMLGIHESYTHFDSTIVMHINSVFTILNQMGIGPEEGCFITDDSEEWQDYITKANMNMVKTYMYLKVRLLFDPPQNGALMDSINRNISELEWRLYLEADREVN